MHDQMIYKFGAILHACVGYPRPNSPKLGDLALIVLVREPSRPRRAPLGFWRDEIKKLLHSYSDFYLKADDWYIA